MCHGNWHETLSRDVIAHVVTDDCGMARLSASHAIAPSWVTLASKSETSVKAMDASRAVPPISDFMIILRTTFVRSAAALAAKVAVLLRLARFTCRVAVLFWRFADFADRLALAL